MAGIARAAVILKRLSCAKPSGCPMETKLQQFLQENTKFDPRAAQIVCMRHGWCDYEKHTFAAIGKVLCAIACLIRDVGRYGQVGNRVVGQVAQATVGRGGDIAICVINIRRGD